LIRPKLGGTIDAVYHSSDTVHGFLIANPWDVTLYTTTVKENKRIKRIKAPCEEGEGERRRMLGELRSE